MKRLHRYHIRCSFTGSCRWGISLRSDLTKKLATNSATAASMPKMKMPSCFVTRPKNAPATPSATAPRAARVVWSIRLPIQPSSAGSSVSDPSIIISTPSEAAKAMP